MEARRENRKEQSERELLSKLSQEQKIGKSHNTGVFNSISEIDSHDNSEEGPLMRRKMVSSLFRNPYHHKTVLPNGTADPVVFVSQ